MTKKKILLFVIIVMLVAIMWPASKLKIASVTDGSTIELTNGTTVKLIGITMTDEGKEYLNTFLKEPVDLMPDRSASFDQKKLKRGDMVYAYVRVNKGRHCLNSAILQQHKADVLEGGHLIDSLSKYKDYIGDAVVPNPVKPEPINYEKEGFNLPQYTPSPERRNSQWCLCDKDMDMMDEACDYNLPYTRGFAAHLAGKAQAITKGQSEFCIEQVCEQFDYCYKKWRYVNDPKGREFLARASESICYGLVGDCDDFAVLMASCVLAIGGSATVVYGKKIDSNGEYSAHAWAEVDINGFTNKDVNYIENYIQKRFTSYNIDKIHVRQDGEHLWLNLDWQAAYPGGPYWSNNCVYYSCIKGVWSVKNELR